MAIRVSSAMKKTTATTSTEWFCTAPASRSPSSFPWIQQQDFYENTTIVISGDHLTMDSDFCENIDPDYTRTVYNVIINSPIQPQQEKNRSFTTMDMFPTTIASLGATIEGDRLGLGTNLFSGEQTLAEKLTFDQLNDDLSQKSKFFEKMEEQVTSI